MLESISLAFQNVWRHKLRSFLTMLGIIIGIASIITIVSTIKGTNEQIKESLVGAGNNAVNRMIDLNISSIPLTSANTKSTPAVRIDGRFCIMA